MKLGVQCSVLMQVFSTCVCRNYEGNDKDYIIYDGSVLAP